MVNSMTGFASRSGQAAGWSWTWELRSVNGRGLDLRLRLPDWVEGLEPALRPQLQKALGRGNVTLGLKLARDEAGGGPVLVGAALDRALGQIAAVQARAEMQGLELAPPSPAEVLAMRGVLDTAETGGEDIAALREALIADFPALLGEFSAARAREGAALAEVIAAQVDRIEALLEETAGIVARRREALADSFRAALGRVREDTTDEARVAQEIALLAVKTDITEEIDRLRAHVAAARALLAEGGPVGRKLDFLTQEFNREANTLCAKAQFAELTALGLDLKAVIDQMREQVQNVE